MTMTVYIAPNCPAEIDTLIRADAARRGERVMPPRPFPWNRPSKRRATPARQTHGETTMSIDNLLKPFAPARATDAAMAAPKVAAIVPAIAEMKTTGIIECSREAMLAALQIIQPALERSTIPILAYVLIRASNKTVTIEATDLDVLVRHTIGRTGSKVPVAVTVPLVPFMHAVKTGTGDTISMKVESAAANVTIGSGTVRLGTLPVADFPNNREYETPARFSLVPSALREMIRVIKPAISDEDTRYCLRGIFFEPSGKENELLATATDGHRLHTIPVYAEGITAMDAAKQVIQKAIVPSKTIYVVEKWLGHAVRAWAKSGVEMKVSVEMGGAGINFSAGATVIRSRCVDGTYPDYRRVIPQEVDANKVATIDGKALAAAIKRVAAKRNAPSQGVKFSFAKDKLALSRVDLDNGIIEDKLSCTYSSPQKAPIEIGYNGGYVQDILGCFGGGLLELKITDPSSPAIWKRSDGKGPLIVLMPMRV